jgi:hypothetical protein
MADPMPSACSATRTTDPVSNRFRNRLFLLKDTAELLHTCQESVRIAYRTDLIG